MERLERSRSPWVVAAASGVLAFLSSACLPNPEGKASLEAHGVWLVYDTREYEPPSWEKKPRLTMTENGTDVPVDVYPARVALTMKNRFPLSSRESSLVVVPCADPTVPDFAKAYPNVAEQVGKLADLLARRHMLAQVNTDPPDDWVIDQEHAIVSRAQFVDFQSGAGILYLTQYSQESRGNPVNNEQLICVFQGLTGDRRSYLSGHFALSHPSLPASVAASGSLTRDTPGRYLRSAEALLNACSDDSFQPPLSDIKALVASLAIRAERR